MENNIFNGRPSFKLSHRPFLSIIIACYNSRDTLGDLLQSIVEQNMEDDIEVILSDDNSTESYQDIVDTYRNILSIRQVKTDYNFAPGNTREKGVSIAEGEWITFADHDDVYIPNTLPFIKEELLKTNEQYYAIANFIEANPDTGEVIREMVATTNWNHAKFYNLDNLWKAYDVHFKHDLLTHEDIYISSTINCIMDYIGNSPLFINRFCYIWNSRMTSISKSLYGDHGFLETFFDDYLESTGRVYINQYNNGLIENEFAIDSAIEVLLYCYFYTQSFIFHDTDNYKRENEQICREYLVSLKRTFNIDNKFIMDFCSANDAYRYMKIKNAAYIASGPYIETFTLNQWLNVLHADINRITMRDSMVKQK